MTSKNKIILSHIAIWFLYTSLAVLVYGYDVTIRGALPETVTNYAISAMVFYTHAWLLGRFIPSKKYHYYILSILWLLCANFLIKYLNNFYLIPGVTGSPTSIRLWTSTKLVLAFSWQAGTFMIYSTGYWFLTEQIRLQKKKRELERHAAEMANMELQYIALRAQLNPHFFVNTMGAFYSVLEDSHPEVAKGILAMNLFMRSCINPPDIDGLVKLEEEVEAIEGLISIFRLRFPTAEINYTISNEPRVRIVPHVLTSFVENALKHGYFTKPNVPLTVKIEAHDGCLQMYVHNYVGRRIKDDSRGIGVALVQKMLEKAYPSNHTLSIQSTDDEYSVFLQVNYQHQTGYNNETENIHSR